MQIENISARDTLDIRQRVLWPNKSQESCVVNGDETANHFGLYVESKLVGVASTYELDGAIRLRKFAIETELRRKGYGSALFQHALDHAKASGAALFWCDAREDAVPFYEKFGLHVEGDRFYKSKLPYFKMSALFSEQ